MNTHYPSPIGASDIFITTGSQPFQLPGDGRSVASLTEYLRNNAEFNVRDFGAVGDGVADDTVAVQACIDAAAQAKRRVRVPGGTYLLSAPLEIRYDNIEIVADGRSGATFLNPSATQRVFVNPLSATTQRMWFRLRGLRIASGMTAATAIVDLKSVQFAQLEDYWISGGGGDAIGVNLEGVTVLTEGTYGRLTGGYIGLVKTGVRCGWIGNAAWVRENRIQPLPDGVAVLLTGAVNGCVVRDNGMEYPGAVSDGVRVEAGCYQNIIDGNRFEQVRTAIDVKAGALQTLVGPNHFDGCTTNVADAGTGTSRLDRNRMLERGFYITGGPAASAAVYFSDALAPARNRITERASSLTAFGVDLSFAVVAGSATVQPRYNTGAGWINVGPSLTLNLAGGTHYRAEYEIGQYPVPAGAMIALFVSTDASWDPAATNVDGWMEFSQ